LMITPVGTPCAGPLEDGAALAIREKIENG
jgi:hypothetical protein